MKKNYYDLVISVIFSTSSEQVIGEWKAKEGSKHHVFCMAFNLLFLFIVQLDHYSSTGVECNLKYFILVHPTQNIIIMNVS